ncbi:hypothetical protein PAXRUDRAFT_19700 [Paxillus rubicundulus Ve08.2h10]|uniref:Uncharacterized protein n=1 Tax=Paxillus rubicundulus Ve08.2h10 TaxID=930991 RepID=A0A0D0CU42_9AGAM|nr:hypothetical protein PAXRUDRAFT_19700 [Paxillus rubicundulus Ve08.2h10]
MSDSAIESASEDESLAIEWAPTSEEEDMPPYLEEEEGEEDEGEDEKEEADLDVIAESRQSVPAKFSKQELTIMMNAKLQLMSCRGAVRKKILETMLGQLYKLEGRDARASMMRPGHQEFSGDPSHMKTSEALQFLQFIQARQKEHPDNVFKFHHWIDENGDLQESMEDEDDAESRNEDSIEAPRSTSRKEQPTRGKGKGKEKIKGKVPTENVGGVQAIGSMQPSAKVAANHMEQPTSGKGKGKEKDKGKAPAENVGGVWDIGNMQPIGQVAAKNAERPQPRQKGATKPKDESLNDYLLKANEIRSNLAIAPVPSRQAIQSTAAMQILATSQPAKMPAKMPKDKCTLKKVDPVMVPVLGSQQESNSDRNNKSYHPSQQSATLHPNNGSAMHQTSAAKSTILVYPPKNKATGVETEVMLQRSTYLLDSC